MKIIVAHPSKQHSFYTVRAIQDMGYLYKYITTVYDKKGSMTSLLKKFVGKKELKKISSHRDDMIRDKDIIQYYEIDYIISLILNRVPKLAAIREKHRQYVANKFGKKVANYAIKHQVDAVIMYDSTATKCFEILKEKDPHIKLILDVSIATRPFMKKTFEKDMKLTGDYTLRTDYSSFWNPTEVKNYTRELYLADYFFVPSNIVKKSLLFCNVTEDKIRTVPYGVDIRKFTYSENFCSTTLKLIYVGQVTYRKGIHHLLKVISLYSKNEVQLTLVGSYSKNTTFYKKYHDLENVEFKGFVSHDELAELYKTANVFVFPTLGEGYGMVVLEAMSCGLPIISSDYAGGNDAIEERLNGLVFPVCDEHELKRCIDYFIENKEQLPEMGRYSRCVAENLTWDNYCMNYQEEICQLLNVSNEKVK